MKLFKYGIEIFDTGVALRTKENHSQWLADFLKIEYFRISFCLGFDFFYMRHDALMHVDIKLGFIEFNFGYF